MPFYLSYHFICFICFISFEKKFASILNFLEHCTSTHSEARNISLKAVAYSPNWLFLKWNKKANYEKFMLECTLKFLNSNYLNTNCFHSTSKNFFKVLDLKFQLRIQVKNIIHFYDFFKLADSPLKNMNCK